MAKSRLSLSPPYPGTPTTTDGTGSVVWVETHISQGACAYPITPSTNMGVQYAQAVANGATNLWGETLQFIEPESEHSSASAAEGFAAAGGRVTNFTSGQGLMLMKEVLYVISGKRLPVVFNIGARALTSQALNIHAGHDDVMGVADTGWGMLFARNAQEAGDLCLIARRAAEMTETPFFNVQDGFLTTHTLETMRLPEEALMRDYVGAPGERLRPVLDSQRGLMSGTVQNQDAYMRGKIAQRYYYERLPQALEVAMEEFYGLTGRHYGMVTGYRMRDADYAIVALGTTAETAEAVCDYMRDQRGIRAGVVHVTAFRPFPGPQLVELLHDVEAVAVIERMDDPAAQSNPLAAEVKAAFADGLTGVPGYPRLHRMPAIVQGSAGLGSRDVRTADLIAVYERLVEGSKGYFSLNVDHATALPVHEDPDLRPEGAFSLRGYSIGGYGSVTTNKVIATVAADLFGVNVQAYPRYGSEKKGLPTNYYLMLSPARVRTHCEMKAVDFIPLNTLSALEMGNPFEGLTRGGTVFVQWREADGLHPWEHFPLGAKRALASTGARLLYLDAEKIAQEEASRPELQTRMQGIVLLGVFLRSVPFAAQAGLEADALFEGVENALRKYFGKVSEAVVAENLRCVKRGYDEVMEVPREEIERSTEAETRRLGGRTVADAMHRGVVTCHPMDRLEDVARTMREQHISAVVVTGLDERMVGLISTTDLARATAGAPERQELPELYPMHLMSRDVIYTWPEEPLEAAIDKLFRHHVHRLVVVKSERETARPVGILSLTDLAQMAA